MTQAEIFEEQSYERRTRPGSNVKVEIVQLAREGVVRFFTFPDGSQARRTQRTGEVNAF